MELKAGVNPIGLRAEALLAIHVVDQVYREFGHELVVTSINDGKHGDNSYHYRGLAFDCRTRYFSSPQMADDVAFAVRRKLGRLYDVVVESDHIHVEFDERRAERAKA